MFVMFATHIHIILHSAPSKTYYVLLIYLKQVISCVFKVNTKEKNRNVINSYLLWNNDKCYEEKSYHYQIYYCLKVKPTFHEKLFLKEKNIVIDLCQATFRSFTVEWSAKIPGLRPQLKPLCIISVTFLQPGK